MDFLHEGLVYLLYTTYLLLVIVGFLTKADMPQIATVNLATSISITPTSIAVDPMGAIPSKEAHWSQSTYPELGRARLEYAFRKADPSTGLVRHTFKVTLPTLKSVVTDPSGPYAPPPSVDYVTVGEISLFVHARSTEAERRAAVAAFTRSYIVDATFENLMLNVVAGQAVF